MTSPPLDSTHGRQRWAWHDINAFDNTYGQTMSGMTCYHRLWTAHTVEKRREWLNITALRLHAQSDDVGRGMTSPTLDSTHSRMMSGVACHHRLWEAHTIEQCWGWHDINTFGKHLRSKDVGRDMPSPPLDSRHGGTTSAWHAIIAFGQHRRRTASGVACHHRPWAAQTVGRRQAMHAINALGQHRRSAVVGRGMLS